MLGKGDFAHIHLAAPVLQTHVHEHTAGLESVNGHLAGDFAPHGVHDILVKGFRRRFGHRIKGPGFAVFAGRGEPQGIGFRQVHVVHAA